MPDLLHLSPSDWIAFWAAVVTLFLGVAALAGTAVAILLTLQANRREAKRDEQQDRDRVDRWLAEFVVQATDYRVACSDWVEQADNLEQAAYARGYNGDPDDLDYSPKPSSGQMLARLDAAQLVARGEERDELARLTMHIQYVRELPVRDRSLAVQEAITAVRDWRSTGADLAPLRGEIQRAGDTT